MVVDPICRTSVNEKTTVNKTPYKGEYFYFCSATCQRQFEGDPEKFGHARAKGVFQQPKEEVFPGSGEEKSDYRREEPASYRGGAAQQNEGGELRGKMKGIAGEVAAKAKDQSRSIFTEKKGQVAGNLENMAKALRGTAKSFQEENQPAVFSEYADKIADTIHEASKYLKEKNVEDLIRDMEGFIHKRPALVFAGAFGVGFILARFLKSSHNGGASQSNWSTERADWSME